MLSPNIQVQILSYLSIGVVKNKNIQNTIIC
jgi:hypothetical protein